MPGVQKVLLIQLPHYYGDGKKNRPPEFFPLGLGYIAAVLEKAGYDVSVLDIWANQYTYDEVEVHIKYSEFDVVGISAMSTQFTYVEWLTDVLKKLHPSKPIVLGGLLATLNTHIVMEHTKVDFCVIGEGEITAVELLANIDHPDRVNGIAYRSQDGWRCTPPRPYIRNLDEIGFPAWHLFPIEIYLANSYIKFGHKGRSMNVITGRGCPYNCHYCSKSFSGVRFRSIANIEEEIRTLKDCYGVRGIFFNDELLVVSEKRVHEVCEMMKRLDLEWCCQARVNIVTLPMLKEMKQAGCVSVGYGIESGSQEILDRMNRKMTVVQARQAIRWTIEAGILPHAQFMFGYVGENHRTVRESIEFWKSVPYFLHMSSFPTTALPGTRLYIDALRMGKIKDEVEYLRLLSDGYNPDRPLLINFSEFRDDEFFEIKRYMEEETRRNFLKSFLKDPLFVMRVLNLILAYDIRSKGLIRGMLSRFHHLLSQLCRFFMRKDNPIRKTNVVTS
jgi:radical SAM superfamily enzyme YgiQ (UPF0313 family)